VGGPYSVPPDSLTVLKGPSSKQGREKEGEVREENVKGGKGRGSGGRNLAHPKILAGEGKVKGREER